MRARHELRARQKPMSADRIRAAAHTHAHFPESPFYGDRLTDCWTKGAVVARSRPMAQTRPLSEWRVILPKGALHR